MPRCPLSPAGKRMKTMDEQLPGEYSVSSTEDDNELGVYIDRFRPEVLVATNRNVVTSNTHDIDEEDDADDEDGDEDDGDDSDDDEDSSSFSIFSLGSRNQIIQEPFPQDEEDEDDSIAFDSEYELDIDRSQPDEYLKHDPTPETQYPKPDWITVSELRQRKYGFSSSRRVSSRSNMYWFERYVNNSLWMIQRLELSKRLDEHSGSVNSLDFNSNGRLLCSGSDDLSVCIWDWQLNRLKKKLSSGHTNNINHSQFCLSDTNIITTSRDGSVRLINIETSLSEVLMSQSESEIGKVAFLTPQTLVTCCTNSGVHFIDLRVKKPTMLFNVKDPFHNLLWIELQSIDSHPLDNHKIVVAGTSPYVFLYDLRRVARKPDDVEHIAYCIDKFENTDRSVTSTAFNSTGSNLLVSYCDDDLVVYRFDSCEILHRYKGHRNRNTIKNCVWFGDNFVMSGSDDGHIYGWDLNSEHIVCFLEGDVKGIVNTLSVHPSLPVLASSGFDHNVKVWEPTSKNWPQTLKGIKPQICKNTMRKCRALERLNQIRPNRDENDYTSDHG